jgi:hypothetical protein
MPENGFYQEKYFDELSKTLERIENTQRDQAKDLADIKANMKYIYGFAAGIGVLGSLVISWIKDKLTGTT